MADPGPAPALPEHYFRHEFGRLVAVLSRRFGLHRVELCEDAVQTALLRAVQSRVFSALLVRHDITWARTEQFVTALRRRARKRAPFLYPCCELEE